MGTGDGRGGFGEVAGDLAAAGGGMMGGVGVVPLPPPPPGYDEAGATEGDFEGAC